MSGVWSEATVHQAFALAAPEGEQIVGTGDSCLQELLGQVLVMRGRVLHPVLVYFGLILLYVTTWLYVVVLEGFVWGWPYTARLWVVVQMWVRGVPQFEGKDRHLQSIFLRQRFRLLWNNGPNLIKVYILKYFSKCSVKIALLTFQIFSFFSDLCFQVAKIFLT